MASSISAPLELRTDTPRVPLHALLVSALALAVPVVARFALGDVAGEHESLLWLLALVPAFMLSYYRGWRGAATGIVAAMAVFALVHAASVGSGGTFRLAENTPATLAVLVSVGVGIGWLAEKMHRDGSRIRDLALTDTLTGLPNRRYLELFLKPQFAAGIRGRPVSLLIFDLDHFKAYNDRFGHQAGDRALAEVGRVFQTLTRDMDLTARWGGEEFLSVLVDCTPENAVLFADRVRGEVLKLELETPVTMSVGIAGVRRGMAGTAEVIDAADQALYRAKTEGRDRVCLEMVKVPA
jgi:diguanylate cyclase (GGDEF)-like protein